MRVCSENDEISGSRAGEGKHVRFEGEVFEDPCMLYIYCVTHK